jgi:hypothetical protein
MTQATRRRARWVSIAAIVAACALPRHLSVHTTPDFSVAPHRRVVLLPFVVERGAKAREDAAEAMTGQLYVALVESRRFEVTLPATASEVDTSLGPASGPAHAARVGAALGADVVFCGVLERFDERLGGDYGVEAPAAVNFSLDVVEVKTGQTIWQGRYEHTQQPLSADLADFGGFLQRRARWVTAAELSGQAMRDVVGALELGWFGTAATVKPKAAATPG